MLEIGGIYRVYSRNLRIAVCADGEHFIGIREKFGSRFLDREGINGPGFIRLGYYEPGPDLEKPWHNRKWIDCKEPIAHVPKGIPLVEGTFTDDRWISNTPLFQVLDEYEKNRDAAE